jgi:hypothetical protein
MARAGEHWLPLCLENHSLVHLTITAGDGVRSTPHARAQGGERNAMKKQNNNNQSSTPEAALSTHLVLINIISIFQMGKLRHRVIFK